MKNIDTLEKPRINTSFGVLVACEQKTKREVIQKEDEPMTNFELEFERLRYLIQAMKESFEYDKTWIKYYYAMKVCLNNLDQMNLQLEKVLLLLSIYGESIPSYEVISLSIPK